MKTNTSTTTPGDFPVTLAHVAGLTNEILQALTLIVAGRDSKLSVLRAGEIAAAIIMSQAAKEADLIFSEDRDETPDWFLPIWDYFAGNDISLIPADLIDATKTRTLRSDVTRLECGYMCAEEGLKPITRQQGQDWLNQVIREKTEKQNQ